VKTLALPLAAACTLAAPSADAQRWTPTAGSTPYRFELTESGVGAGRTYTLNYDLVSDGKGPVTIVARSAGLQKSDGLIEAKPDDACRQTMGAQAGELARVTIDSAAMPKPDEEFLPACAPVELFVPMSELRNIVLAQISPLFNLGGLAKQGDSHRFTGFTIRFKRYGNAVEAQAAGGTIRLTGLEAARADIDVVTDPAAVSIVNRPEGAPFDIKLAGTATGGLHLTIDPRSGTLIEAHSVDSRIELIADIPDLPPRSFTLLRNYRVSPRTP
jgi:hypothetical protein